MNTEVTLNVKSSNTIDFKAKTKALQQIATLDTDLIVKLSEYGNELSKVDTEIIEKLSLLIKSKKAHEQLRENWDLLQNLVL